MPFRHETVQRHIVCFVRQAVGKLAGKTDSDAQRPSETAARKGGIVIAAVLPQPVTLPVGGNHGQQHHIKPVGADFAPGKLRHMQAAAAAFAFRLCVCAVRCEPHPFPARFDIGQVNGCAAF